MLEKLGTRKSETKYIIHLFLYFMFPFHNKNKDRLGEIFSHIIRNKTYVTLNHSALFKATLNKTIYVFIGLVLIRRAFSKVDLTGVCHGKLSISVS